MPKLGKIVVPANVKNVIAFEPITVTAAEVATGWKILWDEGLIETPWIVKEGDLLEYGLLFSPTAPGRGDLSSVSFSFGDPGVTDIALFDIAIPAGNLPADAPGTSAWIEAWQHSDAGASRNRVLQDATIYLRVSTNDNAAPDSGSFRVSLELLR